MEPGTNELGAAHAACLELIKAGQRGEVAQDSRPVGVARGFAGDDDQVAVHLVAGEQVRVDLAQATPRSVGEAHLDRQPVACAQGLLGDLERQRAHRRDLVRQLQGLLAIPEAIAPPFSQGRARSVGADQNV